LDILSLKETQNFWPNYWEYSKTINTSLCDAAMNINSIAVFFVCENNSTHWPPFLNDDAIAPITSKYGLEKPFNQQLYPNHQVAVELTFFHGWVWPFTRKYSQLVANGRKMIHNTAPTEISFFIWHITSNHIRDSKCGKSVFHVSRILYSICTPTNSYSLVILSMYQRVIVTKTNVKCHSMNTI